MEVKLKFHENVKFDKELIPMVIFQLEEGSGRRAPGVHKLDRSKITVKQITLKIRD
jgi:hypothetical protein